MAFKDILVHVDDSPQSEARLRAACSFAAQQEAHLTALFVVDATFPFFAVDPGLTYLGDTGMQSLVGRMLSRQHAAADVLRTAFETMLVRYGVSGEWRCVEGPTANVLVTHARFADICVLGWEDPDAATRPIGGSPMEPVLFESGRPVLMIPSHGTFEDIGSEVIIGWKPTREAARAVNDALPVLARAQRATVLAVFNDDEKAESGLTQTIDIARHLSSHNVNVVCDTAWSAQGNEGNTLLNRASDLGANLLVIGAYGHTRFRETVFGGVTRMITRAMTLPVLLSH